MLYCGLRSAEVLGLDVTDADIGGRWVQVTGKGNRERRVPLDPDVGAVIQTYLLAERPETASARMFIVAKGPHRGQPLTEAGLRRIFRYHREIADVPAGQSPRAAAHLRHRPGRGRRRPRRDAGPARPCSCRHLGPVYPPGSRAREGGIRCGS